MEAQAINSSTGQLSKRTLPSMKKVLIIAALVATTTGLGFGYYLYNKPHKSIAEETPAFVLDAHTLVTEYDANEKNANAKYLGKIIEVKGVVAEKLKDSQGNFNLTLQGPDIAGIGCQFDPNSVHTVAPIKEGQQVKIKGICTGVLMDVILVDCWIVPENN
jgi:hypothetical protein